jgi:hypothetical protein
MSALALGLGFTLSGVMGVGADVACNSSFTVSPSCFWYKCNASEAKSATLGIKSTFQTEAKCAALDLINDTIHGSFKPIPSGKNAFEWVGNVSQIGKLYFAFSGADLCALQHVKGAWNGSAWSGAEVCANNDTDSYFVCNVTGTPGKQVKAECPATIPPTTSSPTTSSPTNGTTPVTTAPTSRAPTTLAPYHPVTKTPIDPNLRPLGYTKVLAVVICLVILGLSIAFLTWYLRVRQTRINNLATGNAVPLIVTE